MGWLVRDPDHLPPNPDNPVAAPRSGGVMSITLWSAPDAGLRRSESARRAGVGGAVQGARAARADADGKGTRAEAAARRRRGARAGAAGARGGGARSAAVR